MPPAKRGQDFQWAIDVTSDLATVEDFEQVIVKFEPANDAAITRLRDAGRVELGARTYSQFFKMDGHAAGGVAIYQLPEANSLDTAAIIRKTMERMSKDFPKGLNYNFPFDT